MYGYSVRAADTFGATEQEPVRLRLNRESIPTGVAPREEVAAGRHGFELDVDSIRAAGSG